MKVGRKWSTLNGHVSMMNAFIISTSSVCNWSKIKLFQTKFIIALVVVVAAVDAIRLRYRPGSGASSTADTAGSGSSPAWCKNLDCPTFKVLQRTQVWTEGDVHKAGFVPSLRSQSISYCTTFSFKTFYKWNDASVLIEIWFQFYGYYGLQKMAAKMGSNRKYEIFCYNMEI